MAKLYRDRFRNPLLCVLLSAEDFRGADARETPARPRNTVEWPMDAGLYDAMNVFDKPSAIELARIAEARKRGLKANRYLVIALFIAVLSFYAGCAKNDGAQEHDGGNRFSYECESLAGFDLNYRKAEFGRNGDSGEIVVVYLHGGSGQGNDNDSQLQTQAVDDICDYLTDNKFNFVFVVPQAPFGQQWTGDAIAAVKALLDRYSCQGDQKVYILGGSMGGYGVWNMLAAYPEYFSGAMPVACNTPDGVPEGAAGCKIISVVGRKDPKRDIGAIRSFFRKMDGQGFEAKVDVEEGWNHRETCEWSFTDERLGWLFGR